MNILKRLDDKCIEMTIAFLNSRGGTINVLTEDVDQSIKDYKKLIRSSIRPSINLPITYKVIFDAGKTVLQIVVSPLDRFLAQTINKLGGNAYVIRDGAITELNPSEKEALGKRKQGLVDPLKEERGLLVEPTFRYLKVMLGATSIEMDNETFDNVHGLKNEVGQYNMNADLFADQCPYPLYFYRVHGVSIGDDFVRTDYGHRPFFLAYEAVKMRIRAELEAKSDLFQAVEDFGLIDELIINAFVHNDYQKESPSFYVYDNRLEIVNRIRPGADVEDNGFPKNPSLFKTFKDLGLTKGRHYGSTLIKGVDYIKREREDELTYLVTVYFHKPLREIEEESRHLKSLPLKPIDAKVYTVLKDNPTLRAMDVSYILNCSLKSVERSFLSLQRAGCLKRLGSKRYGRWEILKEL